MRGQEPGFDYHRYRELLAQAVDEERRRALIELLIDEKARDRLAAQRTSDRAAITAATIAKVLGDFGNSRLRPSEEITIRLRMPGKAA